MKRRENFSQRSNKWSVSSFDQSVVVANPDTD